MLADFKTELKQCSNPECRECKPLSEFNKNKAHKDGLHHYCKTCSRKKNRDSSYVRDKEKQAAYMKEYNRKHKYGLSSDDVSMMLSTQKNECAICKKRLGTTVDIDHNHETGVVRGILCRSCNVGLGLFSDDSEVLTNAILYLMRDSFDIRNLSNTEE